MMFIIESTDQATSARAGMLRTAHGVIPTPVFMPVGTGATVKGVFHRDLKNEIDAPVILANTYHLYLRPGTDIISRAGGVHSFMAWDRAVLTDSGGYQVFSLAANRKLTEEGAIFRSHIDGSKHLFTPERVVDIQRAIGADIMMAFDECAPWPCDHSYAKKSMELTHRWLDRCVVQAERTQPLYGAEQMLFPIVQGAVYSDLRKISAEKCAATGMPGMAIGGLSVGEPAEEMYRMIEVVNGILPEDKPRYLMGVGTPANILEGIARGVDLFDCVMPTRNGRNGMLFTAEGIINIRNQRWADDFSPIDPGSQSEISRTYSKAYLRHLVISGEMLGAQIATVHNLAFYLSLVKEARERILDGTFGSWKERKVREISERV
ncbi:MAG TPA: tRNA guanosine(34) transglycosylase Tgt [Bacteroidales bacterium]|nr:tRNA guanosine(34) transglycosylase Tgt [Bacteroidales bacterium]HNT92635.1 tRNA guanosine(34) transglycosylase Tgt [Bacteroidales bacterium]